MAVHPKKMSPEDVAREIDLYGGQDFARRLRLLGLRRAGNHAVLNWIFRNLPENQYILFNNCSFGRSPVESYNQIEIGGRKLGKNKRGDWRQLHFMRRADDSAALIVSYEKFPFNAIERGDTPFDGFRNADFGRTVLLTRSYLNWLASIVLLLNKLTETADKSARRL